MFVSVSQVLCKLILCVERESATLILAYFCNVKSSFLAFNALLNSILQLNQSSVVMLVLQVIYLMMQSSITYALSLPWLKQLDIHVSNYKISSVIANHLPYILQNCIVISIISRVNLFTLYCIHKQKVSMHRTYYNRILVKFYSPPVLYSA